MDALSRELIVTARTRACATAEAAVGRSADRRARHVPSRLSREPRTPATRTTRARSRALGRTLLAVAIRARDADAVTDAPPTLADVLDRRARHARLGHRTLRARRHGARRGSGSPHALLELAPDARGPARRREARARRARGRAPGARARQRRARRARLARGRVRADARARPRDDAGARARRHRAAMVAVDPLSDSDSDDDTDALRLVLRASTRAAACVARHFGARERAAAADDGGTAPGRRGRSCSTANLCSSAWFRAATAAPFRARASRRRRRGALAGRDSSASTRGMGDGDGAAAARAGERCATSTDSSGVTRATITSVGGASCRTRATRARPRSIRRIRAPRPAAWTTGCSGRSSSGSASRARAASGERPTDSAPRRQVGRQAQVGLCRARARATSPRDAKRSAARGGSNPRAFSRSSTSTRTVCSRRATSGARSRVSTWRASSTSRARETESGSDASGGSSSGRYSDERGARGRRRARARRLLRRLMRTMDVIATEPSPRKTWASSCAPTTSPACAMTTPTRAAAATARGAGGADARLKTLRHGRAHRAARGARRRRRARGARRRLRPPSRVEPTRRIRRRATNVLGNQARDCRRATRASSPRGPATIGHVSRRARRWTPRRDDPARSPRRTAARGARARSTFSVSTRRWIRTRAERWWHSRAERRRRRRRRRARDQSDASWLSGSASVMSSSESGERQR